MWYTVCMKKVIIFGLFFALCSGCVAHPLFAHAKDTCYVDAKDGDNDNSGKKDKPFKTIKKALKKNCKTIVLEKGMYKDDITIDRSVTIKGVNKNDAVITGAALITGNATLKNLTVKTGGIKIDHDADVTITDATVKDARIGINVADGKVKVNNCTISKNAKGFYLQAGTHVRITDTEVKDNDEEGIDIRAHVSGTISDNVISHNGESGIEVILGKARLDITKNRIKKNRASGVALQFYKSTSKKGAVKIRDNIISDNRDFGVNCKAPSGGKPGVGYWSESTSMKENKVQGNKKGDFADRCAFSDETKDTATKTAEQKRAEEAQKAAALQKAQEEQQRKQEERAAQQQKAQEEEQARKDAQKAEELRKHLQKQQELRTQADAQYTHVQEITDTNHAREQKIADRSAFTTFLIGPRYKEMHELKETIAQYDTAIAAMTNVQQQLDPESAAHKDVVQKITESTQMQQHVTEVVAQYNDEFSLFGWLFAKKYRDTPNAQ
ncbi:MAG: hypothetical protein CSA81_13410 [Acidobacteria bacterium]|nr:MAG: hypothetical protein CSA81_13410 [Acidobacteriota bacterium]